MAKILNVTPIVSKVNKSTDKVNKEANVNGTGKFSLPKYKKNPPPQWAVKAERVNGRTAMLGFTSAMVTELVTDENVMHQFMDNLPLVVMASGLVTVGTAANPKDDGLIWGLFRPDAELVNGRAAMVGMVALILNETVFKHIVF